MTKLFATVLALCVLGNVHAYAGTYLDALRQCGTEWKASPGRAKVEKGKGMEAWQAFRKDCTAKIGWESKSGKGQKKAVAGTAEAPKEDAKQ